MKEKMEEKQTETVETMEIYHQISMYLTEEKLLTQAERIRFLKLLEDGAYA